MVRLSDFRWPALTVLGAFLAFLCLSYLAVSLPSDRLRSEILKAFQAGQLVEVDRLHFNAGLGDHQYNDCLVLTMSLLHSGDTWKDAVSPLMCQKVHSQETTGEGTVCGMLYDSASGPGQDQCSEVRYHRYVHGHRLLATLLVPALGVEGLRKSLLGANYLALVALLLVAFIPPGRRTIARGPLLVIALGFGAFYGLNYFGGGPVIYPGGVEVQLPGRPMAALRPGGGRVCDPDGDL